MTEILILNLLDSRPMYGAEMIEEIKKLSGNVVIMSLPALYSALHRMADKRWVNSYQKQSTIGGRCRVYNITKYGREYLEDHPIEINYNEITNNIVNNTETTNVTNNGNADNVTFSTLENSISLPLNKEIETINSQSLTQEPVVTTPVQNTEQVQIQTEQVLNKEPETAAITEQQTNTASKATTKPKIQTSAYISPTDKIITTPEPKYQQTLIGLSGTVGGNDLRPLIKLNKVKVGNDYVMINRLRMVSTLFTAAIFFLVNFICSLTKVVQAEYFNIVYIALAIYAFINLAIYFVYPRIKVTFKRKASGFRHFMVSLVLFGLALVFSFVSQTPNLLWLILFSFLPIVEFIFMIKLRNRSWFQC